MDFDLLEWVQAQPPVPHRTLAAAAVAAGAIEAPASVQNTDHRRPIALRPQPLVEEAPPAAAEISLEFDAAVQPITSPRRDSKHDPGTNSSEREFNHAGS